MDVELACDLCCGHLGLYVDILDVCFVSYIVLAPYVWPAV